MNLTRGQAVSILHMVKFMVRYFTIGSKLTPADYYEEEERFINSMTKGN